MFAHYRWKHNGRKCWILSFFREKAEEMAGIWSESIEKDIQNDT